MQFNLLEEKDSLKTIGASQRRARGGAGALNLNWAVQRFVRFILRPLKTRLPDDFWLLSPVRDSLAILSYYAPPKADRLSKRLLFR
jgi:hypothetical protein